MTGIRDWANEGATPEERALLEASKAELPSSSARSRTLAALGLGTIVTATTMTATTSAAASTTGGMAFGAVAKIASVVLVVGAVTAGGLAWHASHEKARAVTAPARGLAMSGAVVSKAKAPETAPPLPPNPAPPEAQESETPVRALSGRLGRPRAASSASSDTLSLEVAALEKAHAALGAHDPDGALRALDRYRARFPGGALSSEESVLRVQAVLARGDKSHAAALANEFRAAHPDSPYERGVRDLVSKEPPKP